jgi:hypothetical protein
VDVESGKRNHAKYGLAGLLDELGDGGKDHAGDEILRALEARNQPYLFKLRMSKGVQRLVRFLLACADWTDAGQGWERDRRVVVMRRAVTEALALEDQDQQPLGFIEAKSGVTAYEHAVLITSLPAGDFDLPMMAQPYRDRADGENGFDELKNQWGRGGFTTQDLARCRLSAQAVALVCNWWNPYLRMIEPRKHLEALTARPLLMTAVAKVSDHANQRTIRITPMHALAQQATGRLQAVSAILKECKQTAEQSTGSTTWQLICRHIRAVLLALNRLRGRLIPARRCRRRS